MRTLHSLKQAILYPILTEEQQRGIVNFQDTYQNDYPITVTRETPPSVYYTLGGIREPFYNISGWVPHSVEGRRLLTYRPFSWAGIAIIDKD